MKWGFQTSFIKVFRAKACIFYVYYIPLHPISKKKTLMQQLMTAHNSIDVTHFLVWLQAVCVQWFSGFTS